METLLSQPCLLRDTASCLSLIPALPKLLYDHSQALAAKKQHSSTEIWDAAATKTNCDALPSAAVPLPLQAPSLSCWCGGCNAAAAPRHLLASVPETLLSSPSRLLTWCQSKLQHCSELVLSGLCSQPVPRDTFLWLPEASQEEKPSWAPPCLPSCSIGKGQIIISSALCSPLSRSLLWHN